MMAPSSRSNVTRQESNYAARVLLFPDRATLAFLAGLAVTDAESAGQPRPCRCLSFQVRSSKLRVEHSTNRGRPGRRVGHRRSRAGRHVRESPRSDLAWVSPSKTRYTGPGRVKVLLPQG